MGAAGTTRKGGRRTKDAALVLRDKYWALRLKAFLPNESYSSLERALWEGIQIGRRGEGQGYSQPFALAKVAAGTRGLSPDLEGVPPVVKKAGELWPDSEDVYRSCTWQALHAKAWLHRAVGRAPFACTEVLRRLPSWQVDLSGRPRATEAWTRRVGRLTHLDALGLLLFSGSHHAGGELEAYLANLYVPAVYGRLCRKDPSFAAIAAEVKTLVMSAYPEVPALDDPAEQRAFAPRSKRAGDMMPF